MRLLSQFTMSLVKIYFSLFLLPSFLSLPTFLSLLPYLSFALPSPVLHDFLSSSVQNKDKTKKRAGHWSHNYTNYSCGKCNKAEVCGPMKTCRKEISLLTILSRELGSQSKVVRLITIFPPYPPCTPPSLGTCACILFWSKRQNIKMLMQIADYVFTDFTAMSDNLDHPH